METKFTPGPWGIWNYTDVFQQEDVFGTNQIADCCALGSDLTASEQSANARLIAAAPELYEALKWFVENDDTNEGDEPLEHLGGRTWDDVNSYWLDGLKNARAALAKAEGRS